jgi:hypothetical protein
MACYYYTLNISQLDIDAATGNFSQPDYTVFVNYTDCNGDPQTTSFGLAGIYTDIICVDELSFPSIYYYTNDNASLATYSTSTQEGLCSAAETPTPTPTFVPPTPTPTPTIQGTCWTIKIANGDAPIYCNETSFNGDPLYIQYTDNSGVYHNVPWFSLPYSITYEGYNTYYLCLQNSTSPSYAYGGIGTVLICSTEESFGSCFDDTVCSIPPSPTPTNTPTTTTTLTATPTRTPTQTPTPNACWNYTFGPNTFSTTYEYWTCSTDQSNLLFVAANTTVGPYCSARLPTGGVYTRLDVCGSIPPTPTPTPTPSTTTTLTATPTRTPTQTPTLPTAYPYLGRTTPDAGNSADACTSYLTVRPYFVAKSSLASIVVGDRFYNSYPSTPTNGGNNWVALKSSGVGTAYSFQIDTSGYVIQVGGACAPDPTPTSTTTLTATQTPTNTPTTTTTLTATPTQTPTNTPTSTTTLTATPSQTRTQTPTTTTTLTATSTQTATPTPTRTSLPCDINYSNVANEGGACGLYIQNIPPCQAGTLTAGSLASNSGCTVGTYVIDWYLNTTGGTPSFTSGSAISAATDVTVVQPFTNEPVQGGTWYPVVRFAFLNGVKYTSNINLATSIVVYSPDLGTVVSPLCAESYNCSSGNSGSTYPVSISYTNTTQNATQAQRSISWSLSSINKYFAWRFYGYTVYDTISISYVSPSGNTTTQIENWVVGDDASTTNLNSNPKVYNPQNGSGINLGYLAMVTPLTGFTYTNGDYLLINITPNPTISNTNWAFQAKCLTDSSSLDCGSLFNGNFAQYGYNVSGIGASYNSSSCYLTVSGITRNGPTYTATTSNNNFFKYNGSYVGSSVGTTVISPATVNASVNAYFQYPYYPYAYCTNQNSSTIITKSGATITLTFNDTTDYNTYKTQYTNAANSPYITNYTGDSTNLNYYKYFNLGILSGTTCGDSLGVSYSYTTHITSPFTFDDVNKKITVVLSPGVNGLTSGVTCDNTYSTVQSTINSINSNIESSNYTITTYVRRGNSAYYTAVGSSWLYQYSGLINYYADYAVITPKPNVCQSSISGFVDGTNYWISYPYYMAYTITNSSDPVNNFKVENYLNSSGVPGTLTLLYQKTNGVVVYP